MRLCSAGFAIVGLESMSTDTRIHVHALVDQLAPVQRSALETLLQSMVDPLGRKLALAPIDDEPFTEEDRQAIAEADQSSENVALEDVLSDFGLSMDDWERMGKTPLAPKTIASFSETSDRTSKLLESKNRRDAYR